MSQQKDFFSSKVLGVSNFLRRSCKMNVKNVLLISCLVLTLAFGLFVSNSRADMDNIEASDAEGFNSNDYGITGVLCRLEGKVDGVDESTNLGQLFAGTILLTRADLENGGFELTGIEGTKVKTNDEVWTNSNGEYVVTFFLPYALPPGVVTFSFESGSPEDGTIDFTVQIPIVTDTDENYDDKDVFKNGDTVEFTLTLEFSGDEVDLCEVFGDFRQIDASFGTTDGKVLKADESNEIPNMPETTPRGMAHVIKLIPIDNDMIITLWVLDQTWDLCKVELFDTKDNVIANMTIDQLQLVTSLPDSTFAVDTSAMAELPYDSLIEILDLKLTSVAMSGVPIVADLYPSSSTIRQEEKVDVISNALDSESEESELIPSIEYKASNGGSWTVLNAEYAGVAPMGSWKAIFAPTLEYPPGSYDLRVSYTDKSGNTSEPFEFLNAIKVTPAPPNIVSFTPLLQEKQVSTLASISVTFSQEMNKASVESSFSLTDSLGVIVPGLFEWSDTSFVFKPQENLKYNSVYTVKIAGTAMGINMESIDADLNGAGEGSPKDDFVWTFTTETIPVLAVQLRSVSKDVIKDSIVVVDVVAEDISKLGSFTFDVNFNPTIIKIIKVEQAIFANWRPRPKDIGESDVWLPVIIDSDKGKATIAISKTRDVGVTGSGVLATITFEAISAGESSIDFQDVLLKNILGEDINFVSRDAKLLVLDFGLYDVNKDGVVDILDFIEMRPEGKADINGDGVVDILDIVASMGSGQNLGLWDTNGDGIVNILDFIKVQSDLGINPDINNDGVVDILDIVSMLNGAAGAPALNLVNELGASFPNPTNPEAWIPFKLADGSDVVVRIYNTSGQLVRTLDLGYRLPGKYTTEATAAHWDGKDENGQRISSGVYFYNIKAGNFTATRKLIVLQ